MDQTLSLYLLETLHHLDAGVGDLRARRAHAGRVHPRRPRPHPAQAARQAEGPKPSRQMKAEGVEYDQRMEKLEKLEYPKPLRDFVYVTFNAFADAHPWVGEENIRPKSIAREMFEGFRTVPDYVQDYDLERAEGLLLRHLNSVYKVLAQTVPDGIKTGMLLEMELYLRDMIRAVDSSLLDEWDRMRTGVERSASARRSLSRSMPVRSTSLPTPRRSPPPSAPASSRSSRTGRSARTRPPWRCSTRRSTRRGRVECRRPEGAARRAPAGTRHAAPRPRGAQPEAHQRGHGIGQRFLARPADAGRHAGPQRLAHRIRRRPALVACGRRAGAAVAEDRQPYLASVNRPWARSTARNGSCGIA